MEIWTILVAAGSGSRMGASINKVFIKLKNKTILQRSIEAFEGMCDGIVLVTREEDKNEAAKVIKENNLEYIVKNIVSGGMDRQESVYNGLMSLQNNVDMVIIHDAARPFIRKNVIRDVVKCAQKHKAAIVVTPIVNTIKQINCDNKVNSTLNREELCSVQTPQVFEKNLIVNAHKIANDNNFRTTDDAALIEYVKEPVYVVKGNYDNIKITTPTDIKIAYSIIGGDNDVNIRIGQGFDVHKLVKYRKLILCGVEIPHETGLLGHSDADVALHAIMDALLGAACMGDIGKHFPDTNIKYKGISSINLLKQVNALIRNNNYCPIQVDVTIIAQKPKLMNFIQQMQDNVKSILDCDVNVKATTTEKLGFCGREEGIAATSVCLLEKNY